MKLVNLQMLKHLKNKIKKNFEIFGLVLLIIITAISTSYFNYKKKIGNKEYNKFIENIYLKKTLNYIVDNLDPKYKKIKHKVQGGRLLTKF